jgi:hypothetical protein
VEVTLFFDASQLYDRDSLLWEGPRCSPVLSVCQEMCIERWWSYTERGNLSEDFPFNAERLIKASRSDPFKN